MVNNASSDFIEKKHIDYQEPLKFGVHLNRYVVSCPMEKTTTRSTFCPVSRGCLIFKANIYNIVSFCFYSLVIFILNPILR